MIYYLYEVARIFFKYYVVRVVCAGDPAGCGGPCGV